MDLPLEDGLPVEVKKKEATDPGGDIQLPQDGSKEACVKKK